MSDRIGIAVENWTAEKYNEVTDWLFDMYGDPGTGSNKHDDILTWYSDFRPYTQDLVMRKDIYFMFCAAFGEDYGTPRKHYEGS